MFKTISHLFVLTITLTLTALGITTQQEIEDWIHSLAPQCQSLVICYEFSCGLDF